MSATGHWTTETPAHRIIHLMRANPDKPMTAYELSEHLNIPLDRVDDVLTMLIRRRSVKRNRSKYMLA